MAAMICAPWHFGPEPSASSQSLPNSNLSWCFSRKPGVKSSSRVSAFRPEPAEQSPNPVGDAAGRHLTFGISHLLVVVLVNVTPPGLRVSDEIDLGKFLQNFVKAREAPVVVAFPEMEQHRDTMVLRDLGYQLDMNRIALDSKLLFADSPRAKLQIFFQYRSRLRQVRHFVGEKQKLLWMLPGEVHHRIVAVTLGLETIGPAIEGGGANHGRTGRQQHGESCTHDLLVPDQVLVRAAVVMRVLMNIDDGAARYGGGISRMEARRQEQRGRCADELAARQSQSLTCVHILTND